MGVSIVLVGSGGVGKSALVLRFIKAEFHDHYNPTIDASFTKLVQIRPDMTVNVEIHDTAGQEAFSSVRARYYPEADGFVLCYSIADDETFAALKGLHEEILDMNSNPNVPVCIVGTKVDLADTDRVVSVEEGRAFAESVNAFDFYETSAKLDKGVADIFVAMAKTIEKGGNKEGSLQSGGAVFGSGTSQSRSLPDSAPVFKDPKPAGCCGVS